MCGIVGVWNFNSHAPVDLKKFAAATDALAHRGPDASGVWAENDVALGHRRLSILDLSDGGRQPMSSSDGRYVITFNGEIYNYKELRAQYIPGGEMRTNTDTEVLLYLIGKFGVEAIKFCNGMFAVAVWDREARRLFLARDRTGIKPLYYRLSPNGIEFASEIKALLMLPGVSAEADWSKLGSYLHMGYVPGEDTIFKGISKLPPAMYLSLDERNVTKAEYWNVSFNERPDPGHAVTVREFSTLFADAIALHMRSDVPVGIFLSGGLDSSAVVAQLARAHDSQLKTFSVSYDFGPEFDEGQYARLVAKHFGTEHHEVRVTPRQFRDWIPQYIWHMDEPVTEAAAISLHYLSDYARKYVTVVLSGEGADELLGGYDIYKYMMAIDWYRRLPTSWRDAVFGPVLARAPSASVRKYARLAARPLDEAYCGVSLYDPVRIMEVVDESVAIADIGGALRAFRRAPLAHPLNRMLDFDTRTWLVDDLLIKADKITMASSLELRVPFLDFRLVEFCAALPVRYKISRRGEKKHLLKEALRDALPPEIVNRKKMGFPTPLAQMFRQDLHEYVEDTLGAQRCRERGIFKPDVVKRWLARHVAGEADYSRELWQMVVLEEWFKRFVDK